jgi:bacteriochlorophyllide a dehydrogenase
VDTLAVVLEEPQRLVLRRLDLAKPSDEDVLVEVSWTGVSTGTERLLWTGAMPPFPGMGYPLVPGYEAAGQVQWAGENSGRREGDWVFVPGSRGFKGAHGLFGAAARTLVAPGARTISLGGASGQEGCLLALAGTALHAIDAGSFESPALVVGHGALGRLLARILVARGEEPVVWEVNPIRMAGSQGYRVTRPEADDASRYRTIYDVSGDPGIMDQLIPHLEPRGEIVLAGFYSESVHFRFPPAFLKEARIRVAAEWKPEDLKAVAKLVSRGDLSLEGLVTHREAATDAPNAYRTAFEDPRCVKMILDWRNVA